MTKLDSTSYPNKFGIPTQVRDSILDSSRDSNRVTTQSDREA